MRLSRGVRVMLPLLWWTSVRWPRLGAEPAPAVGPGTDAGPALMSVV